MTTYARDSYAIVQRQIEQEAMRQNERAYLFYDATDDVLRNEDSGKPIECPKCGGFADAERDGELFIGECQNCGEQVTQEVAE